MSGLPRKKCTPKRASSNRAEHKQYKQDMTKQNKKNLKDDSSKYLCSVFFAQANFRLRPGHKDSQIVSSNGIIVESNLIFSRFRAVIDLRARKAKPQLALWTPGTYSWYPESTEWIWEENQLMSANTDKYFESLLIRSETLPTFFCDNVRCVWYGHTCTRYVFLRFSCPTPREPRYLDRVCALL